MSVERFTSQDLEDPFVLPTFKERVDSFYQMMAVMVQNIKDSENIKKMADFDPMTYDQFHDAVQYLFNDELKSESVKGVFKKISSHLDALVDWTELFGYFPSEGQDIMKEIPVFLLPRRQCVELREEERRKHDYIQCIVNVPQLDQLIAATQKGMTLLYNNQDTSPVSGCDYLSQLKRIVTVTEKSIIVWDHKPKSKNQTNFVTIKPMQNIMLCICAVIQPENTGEDYMLIGDDAGFVNLLILGNEDLQKSKESNALQSQVLEPRLLRRPILRRKLHHEWVLRVKYFPHLSSFVSCSSDSVNSVVLDDIRKLGDCQPIRTLSVPRGVNAFDYCVKANTLVTGGEDKIVRLWNPNMFSKPKALLIGHNCIITEVAINEVDQHIISLSTEGMFRVWDVQTIAILQVFILGEHQVDRHFNTMVFDNKNKRLIAGSTSIELVPLTSAVQDILEIPRSHERSINVLVFNKISGKVVSICSKSVIKVFAQAFSNNRNAHLDFLQVWKLLGGKQFYQIAHPHGRAIEVTAAAVDEHGIHLITGAIDGESLLDHLDLQDPTAASSGHSAEWEERALKLLKAGKLEDGTLASSHLCAGYSWRFFAAGYRIGLMSDTEFKHKESNRFQNIIENVDKTKVQEIETEIKDGPDESSFTILGTFPDIFSKIYSSSLFPLKQFQSTSGPSDTVKQGHLDTKGICGIDIFVYNAETLLAMGWYNLIIIWNFDTAHILQIFNEDRLLEATDGGEQNNATPDMESSRVQVVKFIGLKSKMIELQAAEMFADNHSQDSIKSNFSKASSLLKYAESFSGFEYGQTGGNPPTPVFDDEPALTKSTELEPSPILLTAHQDGSIQFWSVEGVQLDKILPTIQFCSPITTISVGKRVPCLLAGNQRGYIIIWDIEALISDPYAANKEPVNRIISWRAHTLQIISIFLVEEAFVVISASVDCSVRVWYALNGHYIGYFGQQSELLLMNPSECVLPSDITEGPVEGKSKQSNKADHLDYPLMLDWERWKPFDREGYLMKMEQQRKVLDVDQDKKLFNSLTIPRLKCKPVENSVSGKRAMGAVFRALPVYKIDPLFRMDTFKDVSFSEGGGHDSFHNLFTGKKKIIIPSSRKTPRI
ncbi:WD repeat-containing protein 64-like [Hypanus sabinus]|uniref:WD repeat-containing protein 64-like n=1 Tax=Hypanus sabinus TaxID=79690 RepID=UPI0028C3C968|nr:WD repeat-containing protein 64-like [Hypanus sabinus]